MNLKPILFFLVYKFSRIFWCRDSGIYPFVEYISYSELFCRLKPGREDSGTCPFVEYISNSELFYRLEPGREDSGRKQKPNQTDSPISRTTTWPATANQPKPRQKIVLLFLHPNPVSISPKTWKTEPFLSVSQPSYAIIWPVSAMIRSFLSLLGFTRFQILL